MKNVTITLDEKTARWLRARAARENVSVSRFVGELLHDQMVEHREYEAAMTRFLAKDPVRLKRAGERYASRADVNDRDSLR